MFSNLLTGSGVLGIAYGSVLAGASLIGLFTPCPYSTEAQCGQMRGSAANLYGVSVAVLGTAGGAFVIGRSTASD
jgi:hypothetical protein